MICFGLALLIIWVVEMANHRYIKCFLSSTGDIVERFGFISATTKKKARFLIFSLASSGLVDSSCFAIRFPTRKKDSLNFVWQRDKKVVQQSTITDFTNSVIVCSEKTKKQKRPRWWEMKGVE